MDRDHKSATAFIPDNYNIDQVCQSQPNGWVNFTLGHPCYDPTKVPWSHVIVPHPSPIQRASPALLVKVLRFLQDLVIPAQRAAVHYAHSPLAGKAPQARDLLLFFRVSSSAPCFVHQTARQHTPPH